MEHRWLYNVHGPVPEGVSFSAGTDNGDGTWSLEPGDLQDLQMTVEAEVDADFDLPITATSTEAENGDSESVNMSLKVELPDDHGVGTFLHVHGQRIVQQVPVLHQRQQRLAQGRLV